MLNTYDVLKPITDNDGRIRKPGETVSLHDCQAFYQYLAGKLKRVAEKKQAKKKSKKDRTDKSGPSDPIEVKTQGGKE